ncbi:hypothetical protein ACFXB3_19155 [Streptomyces sp. NPDC059447]|uniref:hypothetical protein n=1 Tax=Streptomyces sp. NPDC059447 TaxID=3346834 RepID=UPI00369A7D0D
MDATRTLQRPKLLLYDDVLVAVRKTVRYVEHKELTATSEVMGLQRAGHPLVLSPISVACMAIRRSLRRNGRL